MRILLICLISTALLSGAAFASDRSLDWDAVIRASYVNEDRDGLGDESSTRFEMTNLRLRLKLRIAESMDLRLRSDHRSGGDDVVTGDLLDVMFVLHMPQGGGDVKLGAFLVPFGRYHAAPIEDWDFIDQPIAYRAMGLANPLAPSAAGTYDRFLGAGNYDELGIGRQKGALYERSEGENGLRWSVGIFSGDANVGSGSDDRDQDSASFLRVDVPRRELGGGTLDGAVWSWHGEQRSAWGAASNDLRGLFLDWKSRNGVGLLFEYVNSDVNVPGIDTIEADGMLYQMILPVSRRRRVDLMARSEFWEVSAAALGDWERTTVGLRWRMTDDTSIRLERWDETFDSGTLGQNDPSTLILQASRRF